MMSTSEFLWDALEYFANRPVDWARVAGLAGAFAVFMALRWGASLPRIAFSWATMFTSCFALFAFAGDIGALILFAAVAALELKVYDSTVMYLIERIEENNKQIAALKAALDLAAQQQPPPRDPVPSQESGPSASKHTAAAAVPQKVVPPLAVPPPNAYGSSEEEDGVNDNGHLSVGALDDEADF